MCLPDLSEWLAALLTNAETEPSTALRGVGLSVGYGSGRGTVDVVHDVNLVVRRGRTLGVVGESGSGKSTLARALVGQLRPSHGQVLLGDSDVGVLTGRRLRETRRKIQLIPQDPYASLDPRMTVSRTLYEAMEPQGRRHRGAASKIAELLGTVALDPDVAERYPHEFSGGQRQRIAIARALAVKPEVIIADEVTSALDSSVQAEVLNLLRLIQDDTGIAMVFITHDLSVANYMCDEISVLYLGRVMEQGGNQLLLRPDHPYTRRLLDSIPGGHRSEEGDLAGSSDSRSEVMTQAGLLSDEEVLDPAHPPSGCPFHPRCPNGPRANGGREACITELPLPVQRWPEGSAAGWRITACHFPIGTTTEL